MTVVATSAMRALPRALGRNVIAMASAVILVAALVCAIAAPWLAPFDPSAQNLAIRLKPPFWSGDAVSGHLLGTDSLGRDVLSRVLYGARISVLVGVTATALAGVLGSVAGLASGYFRGRVDSALMRLADIQLSFPSILLALALVAVLGNSVVYVVVVLGFTGWVTYARVIRAEVLSLRSREFVDAARVIGVRDLVILRRHLLPNILAPLTTVATLQVASMIIIESSLSYLGLGVPASVPTWGGMLSDGQLYLTTSWWVAVIPGLVITMVTLSINIFGDLLRDVADPKAYRG